MKGRLGLATARVPHADRHGLLWLSRGRLSAEDGTLKFETAGGAELPAGLYDIPFQLVTCIMLGPGTTVTHDVMRLLARHGTGLVAAGDDGVRMYASMPFGPDDSALARAQVRQWADSDARDRVARRMYATRLGEVFPSAPIEVLRGMEGVRVKRVYKEVAAQFGVTWRGRHYDRAHPASNDDPNMALNHAAVAVQAAAMVAVSIVGAIPQLGFIHEDSGISFCLDVADLYREEVTVTCAFAAVRMARERGEQLERVTRRLTGEVLRKKKVVSDMIDKIKVVLREGEDEQ